MAGLWTEVCGVGPVLSAIDEGYDVYFISDASGGVTNDAHNRAITRMEQAGAHTMTWIQYLLELQRDWARSATYDITNQIVKDHAGGYGLGVIYAKTMFGAQEGK
jgi:nicotinamidase-related amidase